MVGLIGRDTLATCQNFPRRKSGEYRLLLLTPWKQCKYGPRVCWDVTPSTCLKNGGWLHHRIWFKVASTGRSGVYMQSRS